MSKDSKPAPSDGPSGGSARCGLCGKTGKLTRTPCCGNWICDDADQYVPFSYERNSCFINHSKYTVCSFHHAEEHPGRWQDCAQCRASGPLETYVYHGTNEHNFEKLENPPQFEPTHCSRCGKVIKLAEEGFTWSGGFYTCENCRETGPLGMQGSPWPRRRREGTLADVPVMLTGKRGAYPMGAVMYYGPDNTRATKLVAVINKSRTADPDPLHRWITQVGDIREDAAIQAEVKAFFDQHGVRQIVRTERIIGCPHEEEKDYPLGGVCPHCPFWAGRDRFTHELLSSEAEQLRQAGPIRAEPKVGRNDPCPCGSGKKFKKCCGQ
jgi:hypothetical protein